MNFCRDVATEKGLNAKQWFSAALFLGPIALIFIKHELNKNDISHMIEYKRLVFYTWSILIIFVVGGLFDYFTGGKYF